MRSRPLRHVMDCDSSWPWRRKKQDALGGRAVITWPNRTRLLQHKMRKSPSSSGGSQAMLPVTRGITRLPSATPKPRATSETPGIVTTDVTHHSLRSGSTSNHNYTSSRVTLSARVWSVKRCSRHCSAWGCYAKAGRA